MKKHLKQMQQHERVKEVENIEKNEVRQKNHMSRKDILLFGVFLLIFSSFTNKAMGQSWSLSNGTLTISDNGAFSSSPYPWANRTGEITKLSIGSGVTSIPGGAFSDCTGLTDVTLVDGTTPLSFNYSYFQFSNCPIKTFYWGRNLVQYSSPCAGKATLTSVTIGNNVNSIGSSDFNNCTSLISVTIPNSITSIGDQAFYFCSSLKSIVLPDNITSIGSSAFQYSGLTNVSIPNSVTSIGGSAFSDCTGLTDVTFEDGTTPITFNYSYFQFSNCPIKTFHWGRNLVQYISPCAGKATLTSVTIGNNVNSIGSSDFSNCTSLATISIPSSITSIGDQAFYYCSSLKNITLTGSIASIGNSAFQYSGLTSISIPNSVTSIGGSAFSDCTGLTDVTLEDGTTVLSFNYSYFQFSNCPIKTFYWGRNLVQYDSPCAGKTTLSTLTIGNNITSLGSSDFDGCSGLTQITSNPTTPPTIQANTFNGVNKGIPVYIDCNYQTAYKSTQYWSEFTNYQCGGSTVSLSVSPTSYSFPASGGTSSAISVTSNTSWTVTVMNNASWLTTSLKNGSNNNTFTITATANTTTSSRSATITVTGGGITKTVSVTQDSSSDGGGTADNGVTINGVTWATRNVDAPGTFAANPEDAGMLYQWNRNKGWSATDPLINSDGGTTWDSNTPTGTTWEEANDPSPAGWHVPTLDEFNSLLDANNVTNEESIIDGKYGRKFTDRTTGDFIFLPFVGTRYILDGSLDNWGGADYWSTTQERDVSSYYLSVTDFPSSSGIGAYCTYGIKGYGQSVRSVKDSDNDIEDTTGIENISANQLTIFPNPAKDDIFIKSELQIKKVEIYSLTGALLLSDNNFNGTISVSSLLKGIYVVKAYTNNGLAIEKIVKE